MKRSPNKRTTRRSSSGYQYSAAATGGGASETPPRASVQRQTHRARATDQRPPLHHHGVMHAQCVVCETPTPRLGANGLWCARTYSMCSAGVGSGSFGCAQHPLTIHTPYSSIITRMVFLVEERKCLRVEGRGRSSRAKREPEGAPTAGEGQRQRVEERKEKAKRTR